MEDIDRCDIELKRIEAARLVGMFGSKSTDDAIYSVDRTEVYMKRFLCAAACLACIIVAQIFPQSHITVPVDDRIYHILDIAYIRGALPKLSAVRPYTRSIVADQMRLIQSSTTFFSNEEQKIINAIYGKYIPLQKPFIFDLGLDSDIRTDLVSAAYYHLYSAYNFDFTGDISKKMSYKFTRVRVY